MKRDTDVEKLLADHKARLDTALDDFQEQIEAIIAARVDARVRPAMAALSGDMSALVTQPRKAVPKSAGKPKSKPTSPSDPARVKFVNAVIKLKPAERAAYAKGNGISKYKMYKWLREVGVKRQSNGSKSGRRFHTREYKAEVVAKASGMAPGEREIYLAGENLTRNTVYKWRKELKAPRPAA